VIITGLIAVSPSAVLVGAGVGLLNPLGVLLTFERGDDDVDVLAIYSVACLYNLCWGDYLRSTAHPCDAA
jgi:hypothetical protein